MDGSLTLADALLYGNRQSNLDRYIGHRRRNHEYVLPCQNNKTSDSYPLHLKDPANVPISYKRDTFYGNVLPGDRSPFQGPSNAQTDALWSTIVDREPSLPLLSPHSPSIVLPTNALSSQWAPPSSPSPTKKPRPFQNQRPKFPTSITRPDMSACWKYFISCTVLSVPSHILPAATHPPANTLGGAKNRIRTHFYNRTRNDAREPPDILKTHDEHCFDYLRQALTCHGDTSVMSLLWNPMQGMYNAKFNVTKECRDWDAIHDWGMSRRAMRGVVRGKVVDTGA